jgi:hypothetical protein
MFGDTGKPVLEFVPGAGGKNEGEEGGDSDALGQVVGCAAGAAAGTPRAGSPDVADAPPVPE